MADIGKYQGMNYAMIYNMRGLTMTEARFVEDHGPLGDMTGAQGLGLVRIEGASNKHWVAIDCSSIEECVCPRHGDGFNQAMSVEKTLQTTSHNIFRACLLKCNHQIAYEDGTTGRCGFNVYPVMPRIELEAQWNASHAAGRGALWVIEHCA